MIKNIVFDFGGVIVDIDRDKAVQAFIHGSAPRAHGISPVINTTIGNQILISMILPNFSFWKHRRLLNQVGKQRRIVIIIITSPPSPLPMFYQ